MKITGGQAKGRSIAYPKSSGLRPSASKVRQALFNILANRIEGADFLDLFAGTGIIGLEALSRGVHSLVAVEEDRKLVRAIEHSLCSLGLNGRVIAGDACAVLKSLEGRGFDIIFADPPYHSRLATKVLQKVERYDLLNNSGVFMIEHIKGYSFPSDIDRLILTDRRDYGQTSISFFSKKDTVSREACRA